MATIGIMDSGVGGLSVFREMRKLLPDEHYIYFSDNANCPYGEKDPEFIRSRCREITRMMISKGASVMVIACNTATAAAISTLRAEFTIPFVGMEPAVKPAALGTRTGVIGVLATAGTLKGSNYLKLKNGVQDGIRVVEHVGRGFVELVESGELSGPAAERTAALSLQPLLSAGADIIVLGCTHYPFLLPVLQKVAGPGIRFIDPAPAVARHLLDIINEKDIGQSDAQPDVELISSGDPLPLRRMYRELLEERPSAV